MLGLLFLCWRNSCGCNDSIVGFGFTVAPEPEDDKSDQWMGVSVVSQATDNGKALVSYSVIISCA